MLIMMRVAMLRTMRVVVVMTVVVVVVVVVVQVHVLGSRPRASFSRASQSHRFTPLVRNISRFGMILSA